MDWMSPSLLAHSVRATLRYYTDVLGFREWFRWGARGDEPAAAGVIRGEARLVFDQAGPEGVPPGVGTGVSFYFKITGGEIDAYYDEVRRHGAVVVEPIGERPWGDRTFIVVDPNGYRLQFARVTSVPDA